MSFASACVKWLRDLLHPTPAQCDDAVLKVELELGQEFVFRSVFSCPVSREQSSPNNPPMLLPCGHALCKVRFDFWEYGMSHSEGQYELGAA